MVQVVVLTANGEKRTLKTSAITGPPTGAVVAKVLRKTRAAELIGVWKEAGLQLWGWREGKAGTENKHELPPIDEADPGLLFGDAVVLSASGTDFTVEKWEVFYNEAFKGFEDLGSEDSEDEEGDEYEEDEEVDDVEEEEEEVEEEAEEEDDEDGDAEEDEEAEEDAEEEDGDCYDDGDDAGGGSRRRAPRRRTTNAPEYRRIDMGLRSRVKIPAPLGKRAPRWQTGAELAAEEY